MRKLISFLPTIVAVFGLVYGLFDNTVFSYLSAHPVTMKYLSAGFLVSETLAATSLVKSNSLMQLIFDFITTIGKRVLHIQEAA